MRSTAKTLLAALLLMAPAQATTVFYNFSTGSNVLSPSWPGTGGLQPAGSTTGVSLGASLGLLDPNSGTLQAATLSGSSTIFCQVSNTAGLCASAATSEASANAGHASGLGVGNARIDAGETITITIASGFTAQLISFQVTGMIGPSGAQETGFYNVGAGNVNFLGGDNAIDTITLGSPAAFTTLTFGAPGGGPNGGNTWALHGLTLDITPTAAPVPEPSSMALLGAGLVALGFSAKRRSRLF